MIKAIRKRAQRDFGRWLNEDYASNLILGIQANVRRNVNEFTARQGYSR